jgi:hypothetical protein
VIIFGQNITLFDSKFWSTKAKNGKSKGQKFKKAKHENKKIL